MSTRTVDPANAAAFARADAKGLCFVWMNWTTGVVAAHDGVGTYSFGGVDYVGIGDVGAIDIIRESIGRSLECIVRVSGVDNGLVAAAQLREQYGRGVRIYVGALDDNYQLVADPDLRFEGFISRCSIKMGDDTSEISVRVVSLGELLRRSSNAKATAEDQKSRFPGDTFFDFLPALQTRVVTWGQSQIAGHSVGSGGGAQRRGFEVPNKL